MKLHQTSRLLGALLAFPLASCLIHIDTDGNKDWVNQHGRSSQRNLTSQRTLGSGDLASESRQLENFERLRLSGGPFSVSVQTGSAAGMELRGDRELLPMLRTTVADGLLHVELDSQYEPSEPLEIRLLCPGLRALQIEGASQVLADVPSGEAFELSISGSADLELRGEVDRLLAKVSGSAKIEASLLHAREAHLEISGAADAVVHASERLHVQISGSGKVVYRGNPIIEQSISGSGTLSNR